MFSSASSIRPQGQEGQEGHQGRALAMQGAVYACENGSGRVVAHVRPGLGLRLGVHSGLPIGLFDKCAKLRIVRASLFNTSCVLASST